MSFDIGSIVGGSLGTMVKDIGGTVRSFITTDADEMKLNLEGKRLENELKVVVNDHILKASAEANQALATYEAEITERHKTDMASDSWLSKNVRPLTLIFFSVMTIILVYFSTFSNLDLSQIDVLKQWTAILSGLLTTMVMFYFGGRSIEKLKDVVAKVAKLKAEIVNLKSRITYLKGELEIARAELEYPVKHTKNKKEFDEDWADLFEGD